MVSAWIILSTRWSLSSVQAALNVIISVLGTVGLWTFSRYWWRRGSSRLLCGKRNVSLSALLTFTGPGDAWDLVAVLRMQVLAKENWYLLVQLIVVVAGTLTCMFSGPIAKVSLRTAQTVQQRELQVMQTMKGGGGYGNLLYANVLWNDTIQGLDRAGFPTTQLLDYLPPSIEPWTYVANEWDPTWSVACNNTPETVIPNVMAAGSYNIYDPLDVYPAFRRTYHPSWLNTSEYRIDNNFDSWASWTDERQLKHVLFFVLIQSDPAIDDRMYANNDTLQLSISLFHARNFSAQAADPAISGETTWRPIGLVGNATYVRTECNITRKAKVADENLIPWVWTNDTYSIAMGYRTYWEYYLEQTAGRNRPVSTPSPEDIFRFYQAYMIATNTNQSVPSPKKVSVWVQTVELSVAFLVIVILLSLLTFWGTGRYFFFLGRHKSKIKEMYIPDGKLEWMIHAAKSAPIRVGQEIIEGPKVKDRDHFQAATFGHSPFGSSDAGLRAPGLARVYANRSSTSGATPSTKSARPKVRPEAPSVAPSVVPSAPIDRNEKEGRHELKQKSSSASSDSTVEAIVSHARRSSEIPPLDTGVKFNEKMLDPKVQGRSSSNNLLQNVVSPARRSSEISPLDTPTSMNERMLDPKVRGRSPSVESRTASSDGSRSSSEQGVHPADVSIQSSLSETVKPSLKE